MDFSKQVAVCFITYIPHGKTIDFANKIKKSIGYDTFILVDSDRYIPAISSEITCIQVPDKVCRDNHFINSARLIRRNPSGWDKALFYFIKVNNKYEYVWLFEDDVFIPSLEAIVNLDRLYPNSDLICQENKSVSEIPQWYWWRDAYKMMSKPLYKSMVCTCRLSSKLLNLIGSYVINNKHSAFIEYMFNTIAMHNNLKISNPPELSTILYKKNWTQEYILSRPQNFFHPIKNMELHDNYRKLLNKEN
jgi:hypothetical protein